jgi:hypothetical protein
MHQELWRADRGFSASLKAADTILEIIAARRQQRE